jgi:hypothetical protein
MFLSFCTFFISISLKKKRKQKFEHQIFRDDCKKPFRDPDGSALIWLPGSGSTVKTHLTQCTVCRWVIFCIGILTMPRSVFRIHRIHVFFGLPDPDPLYRGMDPDPAPDPDPSVIMQN